MTHNGEVTDYIAKTRPWQQKTSNALREIVHDTLAGVEEAFLYGKPHFVLAGQNIAVLHVAAAKISFMVFDAGAIEPIKGVLRSLGSGDRKAVDLKEDDTVDAAFIADLLRRTTGQN